MKKLVAFLILAFIIGCFSACSRIGRSDGDITSHDSGSVNTKESGEDPVPADKDTPQPESSDVAKDTPQPESSDTPNDNHNGSVGTEETVNWLTGIWTYSNSSGSVALTVMLEFKKDGSFVKALGTATDFSFGATGFEGRYKIEDNIITLYNQLKSAAEASSSDELWQMSLTQVKDIPVDDKKMNFVKKDNDTLILDGTEYTRLKD